MNNEYEMMCCEIYNPLGLMNSNSKKNEEPLRDPNKGDFT